MEVEQVPDSVEPIEPSEPIILKRRGRPKGSLNKKTIAKMRQDVWPAEGLAGKLELPLPESNIYHEREDDTHVLDVDFLSDEILGEKPATLKQATPKRKATAKPPPPPREPLSESDEEPVVAPPPKRKGQRIKTRSDTYREPEPVYPASYLEVLTRGLKEAKAKQYADKVAQYDRFFQW